MNKYSEKAMALFREGYNCTQSVVGAFEEELELDHDTAMKLASSFGGGMGRLREVCGAVSGMFIVAGLKFGYSDPKDKTLKTEHYRLIQELAEKFREDNPSIVCRELLGIGNKKETYVPSDRTKEYYQKRPCVRIVGEAAEIIGDYILKNKTM
ncbi:MAG: C-GCAxxG-C-C family protein [Porcipelethomonas sp.]